MDIDIFIIYYIIFKHILLLFIIIFIISMSGISSVF